MRTRDYAADRLRIIASIMVVTIHTCGVGWYAIAAQGLNWHTVNILDSLSRAAVPLFFMLSGSMILTTEPNSKKLLYKTGRLLLLWLLASMFYVTTRDDFSYALSQPIYLLSLIIKGHYHLWFLPVLAGLYLIAPVLRALVAYRDGYWVPWYLGVFFVFGILRQTAGQIPFDSETYLQLRQFLVPELCRYSGYFVLGAYLSKNRDKAVSSSWLWIAFLAASVVIALGTHFLSQGPGGNDERLYSYLGLPVFVQSIALFLLTLRSTVSDKSKGIISILAPLTLGIYIFHPFFIKNLNEFLLSPDISRLVSVPVTTITALVLSGLSAFILRKIPFIRKLL